VIELSIVVDFEVVGGSLNEEGIVEFELKGSVGGVRDGLISFEFTDISAVVEVDFAFFPAKVINFEEKSLLLTCTYLHFIDVALLLLNHFLLWLIFLFFSR